MTSSSRYLAIASVAFSAVLIAPIGDALAQPAPTTPDGNTATPPSPPPPPPNHVVREENHVFQDRQPREPVKRFAITLNPLAALIGRYSIQGDYLFAPHHALVVNPFFTYAPIKVTVQGKEIDGGSLLGFGAEVGYRFYSGGRGAEGFFIGPSVIGAFYSQSAPTGVNGAAAATSDSFGSFGGAVDIGVQQMFGPGILVGGGFGLQYTKTTKDIATDNLNLASAIIAGGGLRPRLLATIGFGF
jgi:hypothetical protein